MIVPNKLPHFSIPGDLRYCVHAEEDLLDVAPVLTQVSKQLLLTTSCYLIHILFLKVYVE